jgi:hypothetical protein
MNVFIEYYGAKWCKVCVDVKPALQQLASDFGVECKVYDIDDLEGDERVANIKKVPTVRIYRDNELLETIITKHIDNVKVTLSTVKKVVLTEDF